MEEKILKVFRNNKDLFVSGEDLSKELSISRAAVWKHIEKLRQYGYEITAQPHSGYKLISTPDILCDWELEPLLKGTIFSKSIISYQELPSTMDTASELAEEGAAEGTLVIANAQTKGRGRLGRSWESPEGKGIYLSIILRPNIPLNEIGLITLMSGVAIVRAIRKISGLEAAIKWPNDIIIKDKKVAGILTELKAEVDKVKFVVIGVGLNVNSDAKSLPDKAGSLKELTNKKFSRVEVLSAIIKELDKLYQQFINKEYDAIITESKNYSTTLGCRVKVKTYQDKIEGQAIDIDSTGALILRLDSGINQVIHAGDVTKVV